MEGVTAPEPVTSTAVTLLGDSILDNRPYTGPAPDTAAHLRRLLGPDRRVDLLARDGAVIADVRRQIAQLDQRDANGMLVLSVGGNDAAGHLGLLGRESTSAAAVFEELLQIADDFEARYEAVASDVAARAERVVLCTIYEVRLEPQPYARLARVPLGVLNDRIVRIGARLGADVLDLRSVCTEDADFTMQIEPSAQGAEKIAQAIAGLVQGGSLRSSRVHVGWPRAGAQAPSMHRHST